MGISTYLKEIGRGARGARALSREQAADLLGQLLDGGCTDVEVGAFCMAMRIKGEAPQELAGFVDALRQRVALLPRSDRPVVVLPSYSGARKLPVLTPLLALMLARKGLPVLIHGAPTQDGRITARQVLAAAGIHFGGPAGAGGPANAAPAMPAIPNGQVRLMTAGQLLPALQRLLDVRRAIGLRTPAHSVVKLLAPIDGPALVVASYTHPGYAARMGAACQLAGISALLLRGTEGEPVADARRAPRMDWYFNGQAECVQPAQSGALADLPSLPDGLNGLDGLDAAATARYTLAVMQGLLPAPQPIVQQVEHIVRACKAIEAEGDLSSLQRLVE